MSFQEKQQTPCIYAVTTESAHASVILDSDKNNLKGVTIKLIKGDTAGLKIEKYEKGDDSQYRLRFLKAGYYKVEFSKPGYVTQYKECKAYDPIDLPHRDSVEVFKRNHHPFSANGPIVDLRVFMPKLKKR